MRPTTTLLLCACVLALAGCGDDVQMVPPPKRTAAPGTEMPTDHPQLGNASATVDHGTPGAGAPGADRSRGAPSPHGAPPTASRPAGAAADPMADPGDAPNVDAGKVIPAETVVVAGDAMLDPAVKLPANYTVYVSASNQPGRGAPLMVRRYDHPTFPMRFELRAKDAMFGTNGLDQPLYVKVAISETGDVMKSNFKVTLDKAVAPSTMDVKITIKP